MSSKNTGSTFDQFLQEEGILKKVEQRLSKKVYVVVYEVNAYDQYGQYFQSVHNTYESALASVDHIGRKNEEDEWYSILEVNVED